MSNIQPQKPPVTITIVDPMLDEEMRRVKADTEAILAKIESPVEERPRYFPKGYFG